MAKEKEIGAGSLLQMFLFERILARLSHSKYRDKFVLKGGLLIASMIGVDQRTSMDMDTTVRGLPVNEELINKILEEILLLPSDDEIVFSLQGLKSIREKNQYEDYCATIFADYGKIHGVLKVDITTKDAITPREVEYTYSYLFGDGEASIMVYPVETILAEKYETILKRNILSTRARDLYDLYMLYHLYNSRIEAKTLALAVENTAKIRNSLDEIRLYESIYKLIKINTAQRSLWENYQKENEFAREVNFEDALDCILAIGQIINLS
ncbi:nucleotidyl transferase AbiEii/AbiGii toxin family protein [Acetobacterium sp.]|uniref:nucleotidyl transferase AbiEii/AbiGii toxin family protein n=1 Tax=Acetobacterium sp. TaxID=1872094 RepID=UPI002F425B22